MDFERVLFRAKMGDKYAVQQMVEISTSGY